MSKKLIFCLALAAMVSPAWAAWNGTFINANTSNTTGVSDPNWWTTSGWDPSPKWRYRTPYGAPEGFQPGDCPDIVPDGDIFQSIDSGQSGKDAMTLQTTITGLDAGTTYGISVFFWIDEHDSPWRIRAGLTQADLANNLWIGGTGASGPTMPVCVGQDSAGRLMYRADIPGVVSGVTEQIVYIDDMPTDDSNQRTWYDGVGYVPEPATIALLGLGSLALLRRKRS